MHPLTGLKGIIAFLRSTWPGQSIHAEVEQKLRTYIGRCGF